MNNFCHHRYLLVANLKTLSSVSKVQSSPRCPNPPSYMSNGTALSVRSLVGKRALESLFVDVTSGVTAVASEGGTFKDG
jgi:hypothetical protein